MKNILMHFALVLCPFMGICEETPIINSKALYDGQEAFIFWHWDTLYIDTGDHLFYCQDVQHSIMCPCFEDDDVE